MSKASPSIVTNPSRPTGSITFNLYGPNNGTCDPAGAAPVFTQTVSVSGNGTYNTTGGFTTQDAGTYHWTASYSGDGNNNGTASNCIDEAVVIGKAPSSIATAQQIFPQDSATVSATAGGTPTGTVHFKLFAPGDTSCSGTPVSSQDVSLSGGSAATTNSAFSVSSATADTYHT